MNKIKNIVILGSTGSIGTQTLELIRTHRNEFSVLAVSCGKNIELFKKQLLEFEPKAACIADENNKDLLAKEFPNIDFYSGLEGLCTLASFKEADIVVNSLLGMMGIRPTMAGILAGNSIAFANKETLVAAGELIMNAVKENHVAFLPVDSEHSAIFQSIQGNYENPVNKILLTASGGPFRGYTKEMLKSVTKAQALKHPNWSMGAKITIDSASMMNKGLEIIEASRLFDIPAEKIEVYVHPESVLHSAVEFSDGAVIGQMGTPDMKLPIAYALSYPRRLSNVSNHLDLFKINTLHFEKPDLNTFRCLNLAYEAIKKSGSYTTVLNAANEEAVNAFLNDNISFVQIADCVEESLNKHVSVEIKNLDQVFEIEKNARECVKNYIRGINYGF